MQDAITEAYTPAVDDGRARFPESVKAKAPKGMTAAIAAAAQLKHTSHSEYVRTLSPKVSSDARGAAN